MQKQLLDDGIPKRCSFPLKPKVLELKFERGKERERKMFPLNETPKFIAFLDCSAKLEYNQWRFGGMTLIRKVVTTEDVSVPSDVLTVKIEFFLSATVERIETSISHLYRTNVGGCK